MRGHEDQPVGKGSPLPPPPGTEDYGAEDEGERPPTPPRKAPVRAGAPGPAAAVR